MAKNDVPKSVRCSFCGKSQESVKKIVAGPGVYICNECIGLCNEIIESEYYDNDKPVYLVEGIVCCLYLRSKGFQAFASLGSHLTPYVITILSRFGNRLIVIPDNDTIGKSVEDINREHSAGDGYARHSGFRGRRGRGFGRGRGLRRLRHDGGRRFDRRGLLVPAEGRCYQNYNSRDDGDYEHAAENELPFCVHAAARIGGGAGTR